MAWKGGAASAWTPAKRDRRPDRSSCRYGPGSVRYWPRRGARMGGRFRRAARLRLAFALAALGLLLLSTRVRGAGPTVVVLPTTGIVDEGMAKYLADGIGQAQRDGAAAVVVKLDTPGGSLFATQTITGAFIEAKIPIIVWVAPAGGFAATAGTFIPLASNLSLMAPPTGLAPASPVGGPGDTPPATHAQKVLAPTT